MKTAFNETDQSSKQPVQLLERQGEMPLSHHNQRHDAKQLKAQIALMSNPAQRKFAPVQRVAEEEPLQGKFATVQRVEEEEPVQGKFAPVQRAEEEEPVQGKFATGGIAQLQDDQAGNQPQAAPAPKSGRGNQTGMPDNLKSGMESLSGMKMDHVRVHYNSPQPAQLNALAYAQGSDIHVAPGQEQHLPHEVAHVAQQAQGRVQANTTVDGVPVNSDAALESEADAMGAKALQVG